MDSIKIISYNSTGLADDKLCYIKSLIDNQKPQIICLQETWQLNETAQMKFSQFKDYVCDHKSSITGNTLLIGRPYGGLAILWNKNIANHISTVKCESKYIIPVIINVGEKKYMLINCYLPNDTHSQTHVSTDFLNAVDDIDIAIQRNGDVNGIVVAGDLNVDFRRDNSHTRHLNGLLLAHGLMSTWDVGSEIATYQNWASPHISSCIDHFLISPHLQTTLATCYQHATNPSNHNAIELVLQGLLVSGINSSSNARQPSTIAWHKVTSNHIDAYRHKLSAYIENVPAPEAITCKDPHCKLSQHSRDIDDFTTSITDASIKAAIECFPAKRNKRCNKPYWSTEAHVAKQKCLFWSKIWKENGCPKRGQVYEVFTHVKRQYHYAVRRINRRDKWLRRQRMAENLCINARRDIWSEVKQIDNCSTPVAPCVDGESDPAQIAAAFAQKYETIYKTFNDNNSLRDIEHEIDQTIEHKPMTVFTDDDVKSAINCLKSGKSDGSKGLFSDHIKLGCSILLKPLSQLINCMFLHGYTPHEILISNIISIPKGQSDRSVMKNYRGIALASCLSKIIDLLIVNRYENLLHTSDNQFSYKKDHSTTMCTLVVKETVRYYLDNETPVYSCLLDASKAFDLVRHDILFKMLISRGIPALVVRLIMDIYKRQLMHCSWLGKTSHYFTATNGVRQGAILSSYCFNIYIDNLLCMLEESGIGCWVGHKYLGALAYADDIILLCPSLVGLQKMLFICEQFAMQYGLTFNTSKTVCIKFSYKKNVNLQEHDVKLCGQALEWRDAVKHLGAHLTHDLSDHAEIIDRRNQLFYGSNLIRAKFSVAPTWIQSLLFCAYNSHFYGCTAWDINGKNVDPFLTAWNRCVRCIWRVPATTHTDIVHKLTLNPKAEILKRKRKLKLTMISSSNKLLSYFVKRFQNDKMFITGNMDNVINECLTDNNDWKLCILTELINCRDGIQHIDNLDYDDIVSIINEICTN